MNLGPDRGIPPEHEYSVIITTCASREDAERIAETLLAARLAACVQVMPITSYYTWKGAVSRDAELLRLIKARAALAREIEAAIRWVHKYEVPEIIELPIVSGSESYLRWIREVSR